MEQTAVEWLVEQLIQKVIELDEYPYEEEATKLIEQAKAMEKEQIIDAANTLLYHSTGPGNTAAEQYYNETYKSE